LRRQGLSPGFAYVAHAQEERQHWQLMYEAEAVKAKQEQQALSQLKQAHSLLTRTHAQLKDAYAQVQRKHAELEHAHAQMQSTHTQLQRTHAELGGAHARVQHANENLQRDKTQLQQDLSNSKLALQHTNLEVEQHRAQAALLLQQHAAHQHKVGECETMLQVRRRVTTRVCYGLQPAEILMKCGEAAEHVTPASRNNLSVTISLVLSSVLLA
jgi:uncharacterized protein (DUF3084 family)